MGGYTANNKQPTWKSVQSRNVVVADKLTLLSRKYFNVITVKDCATCEGFIICVQITLAPKRQLQQGLGKFLYN